MTPETAPALPQAQREAPGHGSSPPDQPQASHGQRRAKRAAADAWGMLMGEADRLVEEQLEREARLPKPYYDEGGITIYCGENLDGDVVECDYGRKRKGATLQGAQTRR